MTIPTDQDIAAAKAVLAKAAVVTPAKNWVQRLIGSYGVSAAAVVSSAVVALTPEYGRYQWFVAVVAGLGALHVINTGKSSS
jgi:hypothetical protein